MPLLSFPHTQASTPPSLIQHIRLEQLVFDTNDFKSDWTTVELYEIAEEIQNKPAPIIVEQIENHRDSTYQVVLGLKYCVAANLLGLHSIPALILQPQQNSAISTFLGSDIFNWDHLDEIECARTYDWLKRNCHYTTEQIASLRKLSRPVIDNQLRLLKLPLTIQKSIQQGRLNKSHGLFLLKITDLKRQQELADEVAEGQHTVRQLKELVLQIEREQKQSQESNSRPNTTISSPLFHYEIHDAQQLIEIQYTSPHIKQKIVELLRELLEHN